VTTECSLNREEIIKIKELEKSGRMKYHENKKMCKYNKLSLIFFLK
jgi:hypothetical protein